MARGDLGVEIDIARVPTVQKRIIALCNQHRIPVITATQMLDSMQENELPTRAEASDVANAIIDGSDAVMLSGETAIGDHPATAVRMMSRIATEAEQHVRKTKHDDIESQPRSRAALVTEAVTLGASTAAEHLQADIIVVATHSGRTAMAVSKQRSPVPILALTDRPEVRTTDDAVLGRHSVGNQRRPRFARGDHRLRRRLGTRRRCHHLRQPHRRRRRYELVRGGARFDARARGPVICVDRSHPARGFAVDRSFVRRETASEMSARSFPPQAARVTIPINKYKCVEPTKSHRQGPNKTMQTCPGPIRRREFLQVGGLALGGMGLSDVLAARQAAGTAGSDTSVILLYLHGGPVAIGDVRPQARRTHVLPQRFLADFHERSRNGYLPSCSPRQAKIADKFSLIRSLHHDVGIHSDGGIIVLTGKRPTKLDPTSQSKSEHPDFGSVTSRVRGMGRHAIPPYVAIPRQPVHDAADVSRPASQGV